MCLNCQWEHLRQRDSVHGNSISLLLTASPLTHSYCIWKGTHTTSKLFHIILLFQSIDMIISMIYKT